MVLQKQLVRTAERLILYQHLLNLSQEQQRLLVDHLLLDLLASARLLSLQNGVVLTVDLLKVEQTFVDVGHAESVDPLQGRIDRPD